MVAALVSSRGRVFRGAAEQVLKRGKQKFDERHGRLLTQIVRGQTWVVARRLWFLRSPAVKTRSTSQQEASAGCLLRGPEARREDAAGRSPETTRSGEQRDRRS